MGYPCIWYCGYSYLIYYFNYHLVQLFKLCTNFINDIVNLFNAIVCCYGLFEFSHKEYDKEKEVGFGCDVLARYIAHC